MLRALGSALVVLASAVLVSAQNAPTTRLIPYAGTATDAAGSLLAGDVSLTFELFEDEEGGAPLWTETQVVQADQRGRYVAYLGHKTPLPQIVFSEERARWLAVSIQGRPLPRAMLVAVPYALRAADADALGGQPASSYVRSREDGRLETSAGVVAAPLVDGSGIPGQIAKFTGNETLSSSVISESASNRIGFGLTDPTGGGVVDSVFTIRNFDNNTGFGILNQAQQRRFAINTLASGGWSIYDGGSGVWNQGLTQVNGRVGIGTATPNHKLRVASTTTGQFAIRGDVPSGTIGILGVAASPALGDVFAGTFGVVGYTNISGGTGVIGQTTGDGTGVWGLSPSGTGVLGQSSTGLAGHFLGNVTVTGTLSKGGGSFKIDHPLDPTNKYLSHSFIESPDMMNVYNGNVTLDANGEAWVTLPDWFEALNRDFRYQLTPMGAPGPNLYVASEVSANRFRIAGGAPNGRVSWQVTGIRQDAWANAHRIAVEQDKPADERGTYMHAKEHSQPESASVTGLTKPAARDARTNEQ